MPEGANIEVAHALSEGDDDHAGPDGGRLSRLVEIGEVVILAIVAIATAYSGYQAAKWDGRQTLLYGHSSRDRFAADAASTFGVQALSYDASVFTAWLQASSAKDVELQRILVDRFTSEFRVAFDAWLKTDPFVNRSAPVGPAKMSEYHNPSLVKAAQLNAQASAAFEEGTAARETGEKYVRDTVLFASVLFLVALAQRVKGRGPRLGTNIIAVVLVTFTLVSVLLLPRLS